MKGINSLGHCNLVHKFLPMSPALHILDAKAAVAKNIGETLENFPAWQLTKVRNKKELIDEARMKKELWQNRNLQL